MPKTFTVLVPFVPSELRTVWHPAEPTGPFSVLQRGSFFTFDEAVRWGAKNLNGTPYSVRADE